MEKIIMIICLIVGTTTGIYAQEMDNEREERSGTAEAANVSYTVNNAQDFIDGYQWLMETPINEQEEKRKQVTASLSTWIEDNPEIDIELDSKLLKFADTSPELLIIFMGGYTAHVIKNNNPDKIEANTAGIEDVITFYQANEPFLKKDRKVEKFIRKQEKEKLDKYVERKYN